MIYYSPNEYRGKITELRNVLLELNLNIALSEGCGVYPQDENGRIVLNLTECASYNATSKTARKAINNANSRLGEAELMVKVLKTAKIKNNFQRLIKAIENAKETVEDILDAKEGDTRIKFYQIQAQA